MTKRMLILFTVIALASLTSTAVAQDELRAKDGSYKLPPQEVVDILDAPPTPMARVSPTGEAMLLATMDSMPSIAHMARPILRLGGIRIDPRSNARQRTSYFTELRILRIAGGSEIPIKLPAKPNVTSFGWSPDGQTIHIEREGDKGIELWVANPTTGKSRLLTKAQINAAAGGCEWMPDNRYLLCALVPKDRGAPPRVSAVPVGPNVQETAGRVSTARTYQDLLTSPHDGLLFEHYMTAQPALVDARSGKIQKLGQPAFYRSLEPSPDSNYFLVQTVKQPYSYAVPYYGFPHSVEVWVSNW